MAAIVRALSTTSASQPLLKRRKLRELLEQTIPVDTSQVAISDASADETDLEWLVVAKATVQTYGMVMSTLLEQTIPLSDEMWYWDDILGSYANTVLYTLQTSPLRFWRQATEVYADAKERYTSQMSVRESSQQATRSISEGWRQFYALAQESIRDRSLAQARTRILSPFALCRSEARKKQNGLKRLREMSATGIGLLVDEGLSFHVVDTDDVSSAKGGESPNLSHDEWQSTVAKSISLMENLLRKVTGLEVSLADFEEGVFTSVEEDPEIISTSSDGIASSVKPGQLSDRLLRILDLHLPNQEKSSQIMAANYGRPSRLARYWIPASLLLVSGSTILRILANRKAEIKTWIREFGATLIDFFSNWVVEPIQKLIGTIRHDEESEVAIMSKDSLKADRASLERMVVDFVADHPTEIGARYTHVELDEVRAKVKEGDLTPVMRAYERDLQHPFTGAIRGDLVRTLLIQIQKTKVDVEVAIGGIDSMLKSQELLFGLLGLTPGLLISFVAFRWLGSVFGSRKGIRRNRKQGETVRLLR